MKTTTAAWLTAAFSYASVVKGATITYCPSNGNDVCFGVAVPSSSASQGSGNIYFQISAPTSYSWVALGTGGSMSNSNMFVMYQNGAGNVTISPRRGVGHNTPTLDTSSTAAQLTLLEGSGVTSDGKMVANVRCANCNSWNGGSMSLSGSSTGWIGAWKSGSSLATTSQSARITEHDDTVTFQLNLSQATVSSDSNPFVGSSESTDGGSGNDSGGGSGTGSDPNGDSGDGNGGAGGGVTVVAANNINAGVLAVHGVVMAVVFAALYPVGSFLMPLVGKWWLHAIWQTVAFILMWIGFGTGIKAANERRMLFNNAHTTFGAVVVVLLAVQPVLGWIHHQYFVRNGKRGVVSYAHIWWGRILLALGVINGGLGLQLTEQRNSLVIAYGVVAALAFAAWFIVKIVKTLSSGKTDGRRSKEPGSPRDDRYAEPPRRPYKESRKDRGARYV
ncbi:hypothetical protein OQA88_4135 [Cercophora sp. LCS_1]